MAKPKEVVKEGKLNEVIVIESVRANGTRRVQFDYEFCPTMAEQHTAHLSDINYLIEKHKPDELAAYLAARNQYRQEIIGHDFSQEPSMQDGLNVVYQSKKNFEALPEELKRNFKNHVEFLKYIDNEDNVKKLVTMGLLKEKEIKALQIPGPETTPTTTQEKEKDL